MRAIPFAIINTPRQLWRGPLTGPGGLKSAVGCQLSAGQKAAVGPPIAQAADSKQLLFGIIQGATYEDLRRQSAQEIVETGFDGYALGGLSVGEPKDSRYNIISFTVDFMPEFSALSDGHGHFEDILAAVKLGMDMFDCVIPTVTAETAPPLLLKAK